MKLGKAIKLCRTQRYLSQTELAELANISVSYLSLLERDKRDPTLSTIKDIAEALNLHPSTISRTVSNKYIQINGRVVPLKVLLSHAIKKENGETTSKASVKNRIRELVASEDKSKPLSDNSIKEKLESEGIAIKRRTVAKYRETLRILPTHLRRKKTPVSI